VIPGTVQDANLDHWTLTLTPLGEGESILLASGQTTLNTSPLAVLDPARFLDGAYELKLAARRARSGMRRRI
jgi:hypothetical protein